jgi:hypothetical protein
MKDLFCITIGRELGSGGRKIGGLVAKKLGISFYDKELLSIASKESGLEKDFFEKADEKQAWSLFGITEYYSLNPISGESLFVIQSDVIKRLASEKSCLFVGRCADYVLSDVSRRLDIFITADEVDRITKVAEKLDIPRDKAKSIIEKTDRQRKSYYNYFTNKHWGRADSYHLTINSSLMGSEATANLIVDIAKRRFGLI